MKISKDKWGMGLSFLCICHCILTPIVIVLFGAGLFTSWLASEWIHALLVLPILLLIGTSIIPAYLRFRHRIPLAMAGAGVLLIGVSFLFHGLLETAFAVPGALMIFIAHYRNARLAHCGHTELKRPALN